MTFRKYSLCWMFLLVVPAFSQSEPAADFRSIENSAFTVGEDLIYAVQFGRVSAGEARMHIPQIVSYQSRDCYHLISEVKTSNFFSTFFHVEDRVESYLDVLGLFPWRYEKIIREGKYRANRSARFDPVGGWAYSGGDTIKIAPYSQDVLSILYYLRTLDLQSQTVFPIDNYEDKKFFPLTVQVIKMEGVKVPAGKFYCFLIEPGLRTGSIIEQKGKMWIWLSHDARRIPVKIKSKISFGAITMELKKINR
ncbi:MAG: hypothetical protein BWY83_01178 [bacterium ADurb.Bin478]|nr:MAG: hypothetical protein BWY83_01178 [bacterium ADurb.Bin478]